MVIIVLTAVCSPGPSHKLCFDMLKEKFPKYHLKWQVGCFDKSYNEKGSF